MSDLIDTGEMYLRTIFELREEGITPMRARIAERLGQSGPTVSQTVARMERDGLLRLLGDRSIELTDAGAAAATRVMRKHRLAECLLVDVIGLPWAQVHDEACRWEHVMGDDVERRLVVLLDHPSVSPFGNPIPGLAELGAEVDPVVWTSALRPLSDALGQQVTVRLIAETLQAEPDAMAALDAAGVRPGAWISTGPADAAALAISCGPHTAELPWHAADFIVVEPAAP